MERERIHTLHQKMSKRNIKLEMLKNNKLVLEAHMFQLFRKIEEANKNLIHVKDIGIEDINEKRFN